LIAGKDCVLENNKFILKLGNVLGIESTDKLTSLVRIICGDFESIDTFNSLIGNEFSKQEVSVFKTIL
jgi:hypothetical protein